MNDSLSTPLPNDLKNLLLGRGASCVSNEGDLEIGGHGGGRRDLYLFLSISSAKGSEAIGGWEEQEGKGKGCQFHLFLRSCCLVEGRKEG